MINKTNRNEITFINVFIAPANNVINIKSKMNYNIKIHFTFFIMINYNIKCNTN